ncbi:MAG: hypothetical protein EXS31_14820 [Pedosphaera sp.]|nr:hypothetical protein [Pedosphaera sp.]
MNTESAFDRLKWQPDRLITPNLTFRLKHAWNENWDLGDNCLPLSKSEFSALQYAKFFKEHSGFMCRNVLLIGSGENGSAAFWSEVLQPQKMVVIDPADAPESSFFLSYVAAQGLQERVKTHWSTDPLDTAGLVKILDEEFNEPLDLVIDGGGAPFYEPAKDLFEFLFPRLREGGFYFLENWGWKYWPAFQDKDHPWAACTPLAKLVEELSLAAARATMSESQPVPSLHLAQGFAAVERGRIPEGSIRYFDLQHFAAPLPVKEPAPRMPNFLIIGAMRAGTTSLYAYLEQHLQACVPAVKEPMFFAVEGWKSDWVDPVTGQKGDAAHEFLWKGVVGTLEAYQALFQNAGNAIAVGEASPLYLVWSDKAAPNIHRYLPDVKIIAILRQPVERAYSHYLLFRSNKIETRTDFLDAFINDTECKYKEQGFYYELLLPYLKWFSRDQIMICLYDDLRDEPVRLMQEIYRFLGIRHTFVPDVSFHSMKVDRATVPHSSPLTPKMRSTLTQMYHDDISDLSRLMERDLKHWLE